jgi:hypothetical protein
VRHPAKTKVKSVSRKAVVKRADDAFSAYIKARDGHCVVCGATTYLQCGHLFSRVAYSTRWNEANAFCQCRGCNMRHKYDFEPLRKAAVRRLGEDVVESIHVLWTRPVVMKTAQVMEIARYFQVKMEVLHERSGSTGT